MKTKIFIKVDSADRYVTGTSGSTAFWEEGKEARAYTMTRAKDIFEGLTMNGYRAHIEIHPEWIKLINEISSEEKA